MVCTRLKLNKKQIKIKNQLKDTYWMHLSIKEAANICVVGPTVALGIPVTRVSYDRRGGWVDLILTKLSRPPPVLQCTAELLCYASSLV